MTWIDPINAADVRQAFLQSERYRRWAAGFDVLALAKTEPMRPEDWSQQEHDAAVRWSLGMQEDMPEPMREYERKVKASRMEARIPKDETLRVTRPSPILVRAKGIDAPVWVANLADLRRYELHHPDAYEIVSHLFRTRRDVLRVFLVPADSIMVES